MTATKMDIAERLYQTESDSDTLRQQQATLDQRVLWLWDKLIHADASHSLYVKQGDPHWHVRTSVQDRTPSSVPSIFDALYAADLELHFVWQDLEDHATAQESARDLMAQLDDASIDAGDESALRTALTQAKQAIGEAARARTLANALAHQRDEAQLISSWARVPATRRSRHHSSLHERCSDSTLLSRAGELVDAINELGKRTHDAGFGGASITRCSDSECEHPPAQHDGT